MDRIKWKKPVAAALLAMVLILTMVVGLFPTRAEAATSGELKVQLDALKQQRAELNAQISAIRSQIAENSDRIEDKVAEKNAIDQEIFLLYQQITNINNQIATYSMLIADKQEELDAAEAKYAALLADNKERIQVMEEQGGVSYWSVLFQANNFADLLDRVNMVQEIAAADKRRLDELNAAAQAVAAAKAGLEEEKQGLEETKVTLDETQQNLEIKRQEADTLLADLVAQGMEYELLVEQSEAAQAQLMLDIANKQYQYDNAIYQEWLATSVPPTTKPLPPSQTEPTKATETTEPGETTTPTEPEETTTPTEPEETTKPTEPEKKPDEGWKVPINYIMVTSSFGMRVHPIYGTQRFHYGVDLAANTGTPIYATRSGTVTTASYDGSSGYYVQIDHGDGYRSIYMHMTHYVVSAGQKVSQGQVIGYCGSTGASTGPHLHFGISLNGTYVNPANYIPI